MSTVRGKDTAGYSTYTDRPQTDDVASWQDHWMRKIREGALKPTGTKEDLEGGSIGA
jgi:hypothetical protein